MTDLGRIAVFDVDGTLTTRDCVVPFLRRVGGPIGLHAGLLRRPAGLATATARRDRDALKALAVRAVFTGRELREVDAQAVDFAEFVYANWMRDDTLALLRDHRTRGDTVVLVSASFELYLHPLARLIDADAVLAARLAVDDSGVLTGSLDGPNCRGPEKVARLHRWMAARGVPRGHAHVTAYGDSVGDRELLADADVAHWVRRRREVVR